jgi:hypothetical protein
LNPRVKLFHERQMEQHEASTACHAARAAVTRCTAAA